MSGRSRRILIAPCTSSGLPRNGDLHGPAIADLGHFRACACHSSCRSRWQAGSTGCQGSDHVIPQLAVDMQSVGLKLEDVLDTKVSLVQAGQNVIHEFLRGLGTAEIEIDRDDLPSIPLVTAKALPSVSLGLGLGADFDQPGGGAFDLGLTSTG